MIAECRRDREAVISPLAFLIFYLHLTFLSLILPNLVQLPIFSLLLFIVSTPQSPFFNLLTFAFLLWSPCHLLSISPPCPILSPSLAYYTLPFPSFPPSLKALWSNLMNWKSSLSYSLSTGWNTSRHPWNSLVWIPLYWNLWNFSIALLMIYWGGPDFHPDSNLYPCPYPHPDPHSYTYFDTNPSSHVILIHIPLLIPTVILILLYIFLVLIIALILILMLILILISILIIYW